MIVLFVFPFILQVDSSISGSQGKMGSKPFLDKEAPDYILFRSFDHHP